MAVLGITRGDVDVVIELEVGSTVVDPEVLVVVLDVVV